MDRPIVRSEESCHHFYLLGTQCRIAAGIRDRRITEINSKVKGLIFVRCYSMPPFFHVIIDKLLYWFSGEDARENLECEISDRPSQLRLFTPI